jgi:hypothetical protein
MRHAHDLEYLFIGKTRLIYKLLSATELTLALSDSLGSCEEHLAHRMIQFRKWSNLKKAGVADSSGLLSIAF